MVVVFPILKHFFTILKTYELMRVYICSENEKGVIIAPQDFQSITAFQV